MSGSQIDSLCEKLKQTPKLLTRGYLPILGLNEPCCQKDGRTAKEIIDQDFDKEVLECELPVFACFITQWCHSCYPTCLFADHLVKKYDGRVKFVKVDIEKNPEVSARYQVVAVPTILLFRGSQPVKKALGFQERESLKQMLSSLIGEEELPQRTGNWFQSKESFGARVRKTE